MLTILISISIGLSLIAIFQFKNLSDYIDKQDKKLDSLNKAVNQNKEIYEKQLQIAICLKEELSVIKSKALRNNSDLKEKIDSLYERWDILADDRITSIPKGYKEWWDAKEIVNQVTLKTWKTQGLSQTKNSIIDAPSNIDYEEEINQDFSNYDDEEIENMLSDEDDSDSSSGTTIQTLKPTQKNKPTQ